MYIAHAAIKLKVEPYTLFVGKSHQECFKKCHIENPQVEQGFLTDVGEFIRRKAAAQIAFDAGQIDEIPVVLFSEDFWSEKFDGKFWYDSEKGYRRIETKPKISMRTKLRQQDKKIKELKDVLFAIGELAITNWDDSIIGLVVKTLDGYKATEERMNEILGKVRNIAQNKEGAIMIIKNASETVELEGSPEEEIKELELDTRITKELRNRQDKLQDLEDTNPPVEFIRFKDIILTRCQGMGMDFSAFDSCKEAEMSIRKKQIEITKQRIEASKRTGHRKGKENGYL